MCPGIMPILHSPGLIMPGQLGPMRRVLQPGLSRRRFTRTISYQKYCSHENLLQKSGLYGPHLLWNTLSDANSKFNFSINSFHNSGSGIGGRHVYHCGVGSCCFFGLMKRELTVRIDLIAFTLLYISCFAKTSLTLLKTGRSKCFCPPFPGETPPTILVPYSIACLLWKVPCF